MLPNPFSIGSIRPAAYMFGRTNEIAIISRIAQDVPSGHHFRYWCFLGPPGAGKTSMLKYARHLLLSQNWICGYSEASPDAVTAIDEFLDDARHAFPRSRGRSGRWSIIRSRPTEFNVSFAGFGAGFKLSEPGKLPTYARVRELFTGLGEVAKKSGAGVAIFIDEAQALPDQDLDLLIRAVNGIDEYPVVIIMAGLPVIPKKLDWVIDPRPTVVPVWYTTLLPLSLEESILALASPIRDGGGIISDAAIGRMAKFSEGHPLTLQMLGSSVWNFADQDSSSTTPVLIDEGHAKAAIQSTNHQLMVAYYEPIWRRCNDSERKLLRLAASKSAPINYDMFLAGAGQALPDADDIVYDLRCRGIVAFTESDRGRRLRFTIPGFQDFAKRQL